MGQKKSVNVQPFALWSYHPLPGEGTRPTPPQNRPLVSREPSPSVSIWSLMRIAASDYFSARSRFDTCSPTTHFDCNFSTVMEYGGNSRANSAPRPATFSVHGTILLGSSIELVSFRLSPTNDTSSPWDSIVRAPVI